MKISLYKIVWSAVLVACYFISIKIACILALSLAAVEVVIYIKHG